MTTKISAAQVQQVLSQVPDTLRKLASERDFWKNEATSRMQRDEVMKVASAMHDKGINLDVAYEDLVANLEKAASAGQLDKIAMAIDLTGPNMAEKIATLTGDESAVTNGGTMLESYIMGGVG